MCIPRDLPPRYFMLSYDFSFPGQRPFCDVSNLRAKLAHLSNLLSVKEEQDRSRNHGYTEECEE
jgi:hypothetical protein